jgi:hypothetical protein
MFYESIIDESRSIIDNSLCIIDDSGSIIDESRSIIDDSRSIFIDPRVMLQLVALLTIIINDCHIFIVQATGGNPIEKLRNVPQEEDLRELGFCSFYRLLTWPKIPQLTSQV